MPSRDTETPTPLAIVGMSCRMPGSVASLDDFWNMLANFRDGFREFPSDRFNWKAFYHPNQTRMNSRYPRRAHVYTVGRRTRKF